MDFATHLRDVLARSVGGTVELVFHAPLDVAGSPGRKALTEAAAQAVRGEFERREA
jgi:1-acyl-sn-glycerol-3-phosphate acyltransferase